MTCSNTGIIKTDVFGADMDFQHHEGFRRLNVSLQLPFPSSISASSLSIDQADYHFLIICTSDYYLLLLNLRHELPRTVSSTGETWIKAFGQES